MTGSGKTDGVIRILLAALGGEGGGVLMNWIVAAARGAGHVVQATSVPGVAQRTGSTSYYVEVAPKEAPDTVLGLVPLAGRVDVVVSSELVETARVLAAGYVSPERTTVISSTARVYATSEKVDMGDGRYAAETVRLAVDSMAHTSFLLDLSKLAADHGTFVSATMFGALAAAGVLPWRADCCRQVLRDDHSRAGFDAARAAVKTLKADEADKPAPMAGPVPSPTGDHLPAGLQRVLAQGAARMDDYQDAAYRALFLNRAQCLIDRADVVEPRALHAVIEAIRRLALWMAYEDIARVADLKTRPERFDRIQKEVELQPGQLMTVTEFLKPRAEEIADILPQPIGRRVMAWAAHGGRLPFLGKGRHIRSNGLFGYWTLRLVAALKHIRRRSLRFADEQAAIEDWITAMMTALARSTDFAMGLAELPRVLKGYSDTLARGKRAYDQIMTVIVRPAIEAGTEAEATGALREAISAALADDDHNKLNTLLAKKAAQSGAARLNEMAHA